MRTFLAIWISLLAACNSPELSRQTAAQLEAERALSLPTASHGTMIGNHPEVTLAHGEVKVDNRRHIAELRTSGYAADGSLAVSFPLRALEKRAEHAPPSLEALARTWQKPRNARLGERVEVETSDGGHPSVNLIIDEAVPFSELVMLLDTKLAELDLELIVKTSAGLRAVHLGPQAARACGSPRFTFSLGAKGVLLYDRLADRAIAPSPGEPYLSLADREGLERVLGRLRVTCPEDHPPPARGGGASAVLQMLLDGPGKRRQVLVAASSTQSYQSLVTLLDAIVSANLLPSEMALTKGEPEPEKEPPLSLPTWREQYACTPCEPCR